MVVRDFCTEKKLAKKTKDEGRRKNTCLTRASNYDTLSMYVGYVGCSAVQVKTERQSDEKIGAGGESAHW